MFDLSPTLLVPHVRKPEEDPPEESAVPDLELAEALFALVKRYAEDWLDAGRRVERARLWRMGALRGYGVAARERVEDDVWYTATLLSQLLDDELGLAPSEISTAFDLIGVPGSDLARSPRAYRRSRDRLEAALRRALADAGLDGFESDEESEEPLDFDLDAEPANDTFDPDSSDDISVAA